MTSDFYFWSQTESEHCTLKPNDQKAKFSLSVLPGVVFFFLEYFLCDIFRKLIVTGFEQKEGEKKSSIIFFIFEFLKNYKCQINK